MYVDQIPVHEDVKKYTYDAMIFNMDKIKKVKYQCFILFVSKKGFFLISIFRTK